jgi:hypothetical protein
MAEYVFALPPGRKGKLRPGGRLAVALNQPRQRTGRRALLAPFLRR